MAWEQLKEKKDPGTPLFILQKRKPNDHRDNKIVIIKVVDIQSMIDKLNSQTNSIS